MVNVCATKESKCVNYKFLIFLMPMALPLVVYVGTLCALFASTYSYKMSAMALWGGSINWPYLFTA